MTTVKEIGERKLIQRIMKMLTPMPNMALPFWDDASSITLGDGRAVIINTDMLVWETDIPKGMTHFQAGRKSVVMNISDLAAKGVKPLVFMPNLGVPRSYQVKNVEDLAKGFETGAREYDSYVIGGDTNESRDVIVSGIALGVAEEGLLMRRNGAAPGDLIATTGTFGKTSAGFKILIDNYEAPNNIKQPLLDSIYLPKARVKEGVILARTNLVTSSMDSSDGLAVSLHDLSRSSGYGYRISEIPIDLMAKKFAAFHEENPYDLAFFGGEEYELIFTFNPKNEEEIKKALRKVNCELLVMGVVTEKKEILYSKDGEEKVIPPSGWEHFSE